MKAITIWQPWATLLATGEKKFETRSWATKYRGPIAIHAATRSPKKSFYELDDETCAAIREVVESPFFASLPTGCVLAVAGLVACHEMKEDENGNIGYWRDNHGAWEFCAISEKEKMFGDWEPGRYAWEFVNMELLDNPIEVKGGQRIWNWSA